MYTISWAKTNKIQRPRRIYQTRRASHFKTIRKSDFKHFFHKKEKQKQKRSNGIEFPNYQPSPTRGTRHVTACHGYSLPGDASSSNLPASRLAIKTNLIILIPLKIFSNSPRYIPSVSTSDTFHIIKLYCLQIISRIVSRMPKMPRVKTSTLNASSQIYHHVSYHQ